MSASAGVGLWDVRSYCWDCVEGSCPGLAEYARQHPSLQESPPRERFVLIATLLWALLAFLAVSLSASRTHLHEEWLEGIILNLLTTAVLVGMLWVVFSLLSLCIGLRNCLPTASVQGGLFIAHHWPLRRWRCPRWLYPWVTRTYRLDPGASWRERGCLYFGFAPAQGERRFARQVVEVAFPRRPFLGIISLGKSRVLCGWSPEMRQRWEAFLYLAGIPRERG